MTEPMWEEPPASNERRGSTFWQEQADTAKTRPGAWLKIPGEHNAAQAHNISAGKIKSFRDGKWETRSVQVAGTNRTTVYIRYMG